MTDPTGEVTFAQSYDPYGTVTSTHGTAATAYGFTGEQYSVEKQMLYLRARYYSPADGRFTSRDTWNGDVKRPLSLNRWGYVEGNPVNFIDPSGLMPTVYGIEVDDKFSEDEKTLILETLSEFAQFLGGNEVLKRNLALTEIKQDWTVFNSTGTWNAQYDEIGTIRLQPGWYSPVMVQAPNGTNLIILDPPCIEYLLDFPEGSLPTDEIGVKFVLAHEIAHAFELGNPDVFRSFKNNVDLPWYIFARFNSNPLIKRNGLRRFKNWSTFPREVFADVIASSLYSQGLLNQQMSAWVETKMPATLK